MKHKNRIFLKTNTEIREFLWFEQGTDGSLYIGSAAKFKHGRKGTIEADKDDDRGTPLNIDGGEPKTENELSGKLSFHKSGVVNLPTISAGKRDRLQTKALSEYEGALPLLCVLPMTPTRYPLSNKVLKRNDLVVDCGINRGKCIGIVVFVAFSTPNPSLFNKLIEHGLSLNIISADFFDRKLCVMLYFGENFYGWPQEQLEIVAYPDFGIEMPWPMAIPSYS